MLTRTPPANAPVTIETVDARAAYARQFPLPTWPSHLPKPIPEYGISEDGTDVPDMMLKVGNRKVYFQASRDSSQSWYDDIDCDPDWAVEHPSVRDEVVAYGRVLLDRYTQALADAWASREGQAMLALVRSKLTLTSA